MMRALKVYRERSESRGVKLSSLPRLHCDVIRTATDVHEMRQQLAARAAGQKLCIG